MRLMERSSGAQWLISFPLTAMLPWASAWKAAGDSMSRDLPAPLTPVSHQQPARGRVKPSGPRAFVPWESESALTSKDGTASEASSMLEHLVGLQVVQKGLQQ